METQLNLKRAVIQALLKKISHTNLISHPKKSKMAMPLRALPIIF